MAGIEGIGLEIVLWFQSWRSGLIEPVYRAFHFMGSADFYLLVLPLVYWCIDADFGRKLSLTLMAGMWSNSFLKNWWQAPRPPAVSSEVQPLAEDTSYGIPSGHAQGSTLLWGTVAYQVRRRWVTVAAIVYVLLMMISRVGMGVHFPQDVIVGALVGLAWLWGYARVEPRLSVWLEARALLMQMLVAVAAAALMLVIHPLLIPAAGTDGLANAIVPPAALLGAGIGYALEVRFIRFNASGEGWKRALRFVLGMVVVLGIRFGLSALFEGLEPEGIFRLIRYAIIGFALAAGMPWVFVKVGLAGRRAG